MPSISKIRYTNVIYEGGNKRYNDELFKCAGHNTAILLENGGGKTVFIQTALQAVLPHSDLGERKVKETFVLDSQPAHIAIEWIVNEKPRRYAVTAVTLFLKNNELKSYKYVYEYGVDDPNSIEGIPFVQKAEEGGMRASDKGEIHDYYAKMAKEHMNAKTFDTIKEFHQYLEENFKIIAEEWRSIALINQDEGGVDGFFDGCRTTSDLVEKLLLPTVERGLSGRGSLAFEETFEAQRDRIKKHKQLESSIKQSQKIKAVIENYVTKYQFYDNLAKQYELQKQEAKALWQYILEEESKAKEEENRLQAEEMQLGAEEKNLKKQAEYIDLSEAKQEYDKASSAYDKVNQVYLKKTLEKSQRLMRRNLIMLSRYKHQMDEARAEIKSVSEALETLNQDQEVEDLKQQLEENSSYLKGYFTEKLAALSKEQQQVENEQLRYKEEKQTLEEKQAALGSQLELLRGKMNLLAGEINSNQKKMEAIKKEILSQSEHEDVEGQSRLWQKRIAELEESEIRLREDIKESEKVQLELKAQREEKSEKRTTCIKRCTALNAQLSQLEQTAEKILLEVKSALPSLNSVSTIYAKSNQIVTMLEELVEKLNREKEDALLVERQKAHFKDNYESNQSFTAEPLLESWVSRWYSEFTFLQTGSRFISDIKDDEKRKAQEKEGRWAQLIITADGQVEKLLGKLQQQADKLTFPVGVVSLTKAKAMLEKGFDEKEMVYPGLWKKILTREGFEAYKEETEKLLETATFERKQKEQQLQLSKETLNKVRDFLISYPSHEYSSLKEEIDHLKGEEAQLAIEINDAVSKEEELAKRIKNVNSRLLQENGEKQQLERFVEKAGEYLKLSRSSEQLDSERKIYVNQSEMQEKLFEEVKQDIRNVIERLDELKDEVNRLQNEKSKVMDHKFYKQVLKFEASYSKEDLWYLEKRQEQISDALENKQKDRAALEAALKAAEEKLKMSQDNLKQLMKQEKIQEGQEIPAYKQVYREELESINEVIDKLNAEVETLNTQLQKAKTTADKKEQTYQDQKNKFEVQYEIVQTYIEDCQKAKQELEKAKQKLKEKQTYLATQQNKLHQKQQELLENKYSMGQKDERHGYCHPEVQAAVLEESVKQELVYTLKTYTDKLLSKLNQALEEKNEAYKEIMAQKEAFKNFCEAEVTDSKLKNMALSGMLQKTNYSELIRWQSNILERISKTITILEHDLEETDRIIASFIVNIYQYLVKVKSELEEIPGKTKVKTEEGWKKIYEFSIPSWQEDEGKAKLRSYIYNLLDEIEGDAFKTLQGEEDQPKIKKYIKEQFKLRQLLKIVMGNDAVKVKCRKVSSISSISSQMFSWETSTKWSGGEKWSKNMALYLGILNYLAEKKQALYDTHSKVSRVVILDNPFGKASSGHVLEPVFFIAKQLGFQIIALTAHTEGDFIRKYFPIVYSCKLRAALDYKTNIFTKKQEIKKAYFIDNDPVALTVLGSSSQMSLFG